MPQPVTSAVADLAIVNARVFTGDPRRPWADAVLVRSGQLVAVGSSADIRKRAGNDTRVVDAQRLMMTRARAESTPESAALGEEPLGTIAAGAPASLLLLDRDIAGSPLDSRVAARVMLLVRDGRIVFDRDGLAR